MAAKKKSARATKKSKAKAQSKPAKKASKQSKAAPKPAKKAKAKAKAKPKVAKKAKPAPKPAKAKPAPKPVKAKAAPKPKASPAPKQTKPVKAKPAPVAAAATMPAVADDVGRPAPSFDLTDEKGEHVSSSSLAGKPYLLYFYPKDDTPGCTKEACDIRDNFARFGQQGLRVLGVSPDSEQSHAKFGKKYGLPFTLLSDPDKALANAYGVWGEKDNYGKKYMGIIRSSFLVGPDGLIKKAYRKVRVDGHVAAVLDDAKAFL